MKLRDMVEPGDWVIYYPHKNDLLDKLITGVSFGPVNHAALVYDKDTIFETDGDMYKAGFTPMADAEGRHVLIFRPTCMEHKLDEFQDVCKRYVGAPYDYLCLLIQAPLCFLRPEIREKWVKFLTFKRFMVCSELVARVTYEVCPQCTELADWEGMNPEDLRRLCIMFSSKYQFVGEYIPE